MGTFLRHCVLPGDILSVDGDADAAVEARVRKGWNKFRQLVLLLTNKDVCVVCMRSCMIGLHGCKTWPVKKENELTLQRAEMRMTTLLCGVKITGRFSSSELREIRNR